MTVLSEYFEKTTCFYGWNQFLITIIASRVQLNLYLPYKMATEDASFQPAQLISCTYSSIVEGFLQWMILLMSGQSTFISYAVVAITSHIFPKTNLKFSFFLCCEDASVYGCSHSYISTNLNADKFEYSGGLVKYFRLPY